MRAAGEQLDVLGQINVWILACWTFCSFPAGAFLAENKTESLYYSYSSLVKESQSHYSAY